MVSAFEALVDKAKSDEARAAAERRLTLIKEAFSAWVLLDSWSCVGSIFKTTIEAGDFCFLMYVYQLFR